MHQLATPDKNKIHKDYHIYKKLVTDAWYEIQKHLNVLRQKEADHTGGARAKVPSSDTEKKREEYPRRKEQDRYFLDDLSKKDKKRDWREANMYKDCKVKKLLEDQKKDIEERLQKEHFETLAGFTPKPD